MVINKHTKHILYFSLKITNNYGSSCGTASLTNRINNCNYNQAYDILKHLYNLKTPEPEKTNTYSEKVKDEK